MVVVPLQEDEDNAAAAEAAEGGGAAGAMPDRAWQEEELQASALLFPRIRLRLPPLVTSDMLSEREAALAALGAPSSSSCFADPLHHLTRSQHALLCMLARSWTCPRGVL